MEEIIKKFEEKLVETLGPIGHEIPISEEEADLSNELWPDGFLKVKPHSIALLLRQSIREALEKRDTYWLKKIEEGIENYTDFLRQKLSDRDTYWLKKIEEGLSEEVKDADDVRLIIDNEKWAHLRNQKMGIACGWNACLSEIKKRLLK